MENHILAPIDYVEPHADHWTRIFPLLAVATMVFGAFFALAAIGTLRLTWELMRLDPASTGDRMSWGPLIIPIVDLVFGLGMVIGSAMLLKHRPYEFLIQGLLFVVVVTLLNTSIEIYRSRENLTWQYLTYSLGNVGKVVSFPLLVILILLAHRKANPKSPLAAKPKPPTRSEDPMSLLR